MTSRFAEMHKAASVITLDTFGEVALHIPRRSGQYSAPGIDPDRQTSEIKVVLARSPNNDKFTGNRLQVSDIAGGTKVSVNASEVWVPKAIADDLAVEIRQGDAIKFTGRVDQPTFSVVSAPERNQLGDMRLLLALEQTP